MEIETGEKVKVIEQIHEKEIREDGSLVDQVSGSLDVATSVNTPSPSKKFPIPRQEEEEALHRELGIQNTEDISAVTSETPKRVTGVRTRG